MKILEKFIHIFNKVIILYTINKAIVTKLEMELAFQSNYFFLFKRKMSSMEDSGLLESDNKPSEWQIKKKKEIPCSNTIFIIIALLEFVYILFEPLRSQPSSISPPPNPLLPYYPIVEPEGLGHEHNASLWLPGPRTTPLPLPPKPSPPKPPPPKPSPPYSTTTPLSPPPKPPPSGLEPICQWQRTRDVRYFFAFPSTLSMLDSISRCQHTPSHDEIRSMSFLPVTHCVASDNDGTRMQDDDDPFFYYYAAGCSNIYVKTSENTTLYGLNRVDVHAKLLEKEFGSDFLQHIELSDHCNLTKSDALNKARTILDPCNEHVENYSCLSELHIVTHDASLQRLRLAIKFEFETLIYRYEGSGVLRDLTNGRWKTEIQRTLPYTQDSLWEIKGDVYKPINVTKGLLYTCLFENSSWLPM